MTMPSPHEYFEATYDRGRCAVCKGPNTSTYPHILKEN